MSPVIVRPATIAHALDLAANLREDDRRELTSARGRPPRPADFVRSVALSVEANALIEASTGRVILIGGVAPRGDGSGSPWMVGTDLLDKHRVWIARNTRPRVESLHRHFRVLTNWADTRNNVHINWLRWAGFKFLRVSHEYAADGAPFVEFYKVKEIATCASPQH